VAVDLLPLKQVGWRMMTERWGNAEPTRDFVGGLPRLWSRWRRPLRAWNVVRDCLQLV